MSSFTVPPEATDQERDRLCDRLWHLSEGLISVEFSTSYQADQGPEARGHLFHAYLDDSKLVRESTFFYLDDRKGCLLAQAVKELRRISELYARVADDLAVRGSCLERARKRGAK